MAMNKNTQHIQTLLQQKGLDNRVIELAESTRTAQEAALALGCTVAQIIKSLVFHTIETYKPILVLASGVNRVNEKILGQAVGENIMKAEANFIRDITGFVIGGVSPIGHKQPLQTFIDQDLLMMSELWAAAGTPYTVFKLSASDLLLLTEGTVIAIQ